MILKLNQYGVKGGIDLCNISADNQNDNNSFTIAFQLHYMGAHFEGTKTFNDMSALHAISCLVGTAKKIALFQLIERFNNVMITDWLEETQYMLYTLQNEC